MRQKLLADDGSQLNRVSLYSNSGLIDEPASRRPQATWPMCFRRSLKEWSLVLILLGLLAYTELGGTYPVAQMSTPFVLADVGMC
jgi:hypothetical protein